MTSNQLNIINHILVQIQPGESVDEMQLNRLVDVFKEINPISDIEKEEIIRELHSKLAIKLERGTCLKEKEHVSWYYAAKGDIKGVFWKRYAIYLARNFHLNKKVINSIDTITDEIMDMCGNPREEYPFNRRGLIIGDVQSGKTSTYTALINKAADAGYKIVILLTGVIEKLRQQTQERLDDGFVGIDSTAKLNERNDICTGVGIFDKNTSAISLTSVGGDFNSTIAKQFVTRLKSFNDPVLFVLKKNKNILENLELWLRHSIVSGDDKIKAPLLLIDDESDYGSVNTKVDDSSRINACIRKLLKSFSQSTYVAVTATPYANIFIDPDSTDDMLSDDLFPKDFIYALEAPNNYIGARSIFPEDSKYNYMLKNNDDCEEYIPQKHKKNYIVRILPPTLMEAIACFFICNAIRDLRQQTKTHRSMLVNVSRFIEVQNHLCDLINDYVRDLQLEVSNYSLLGADALKHEGIAFLKSMYEKHFQGLNSEILNGESVYSWSQIQEVLNKAVAPIVVKTVHSGNAGNNLNYDAAKNDGLRIIAVGGFSLSRGLTLEGLCVSYFYRNSRMYDTLMQMGRWFGYREHYSDLCQIWMGQISMDWYEHISAATDELRREIKRMVNIGSTPKDFGLGVRSDEKALLITANNKMRYTQSIQMDVSLDGAVVETIAFCDDNEKNKNNIQVVTNWLNNLKRNGFFFFDGRKGGMALGWQQMLNVPLENIISLLDNINVHLANQSFNTTNIVSLLKKYEDDTVAFWNVAIAFGSGNTHDFCGMPVASTVRKFIYKDNVIRLNRSRLGSIAHGLVGLTKNEKDIFEAEIKKNYAIEDDENKSFAQKDYFMTGIKRNPVLIIYPIELDTKTKGSDGAYHNDEEKEEVKQVFTEPLIGFSIAIPSINGRKRVCCNYRVNRVWVKQYLDFEEDFEEEIDNAGDGI